MSTNDVTFTLKIEDQAVWDAYQNIISAGLFTTTPKTNNTFGQWTFYPSSPTVVPYSPATPDCDLDPIQLDDRYGT